ncbi:MAG: hypothetical protein ABIG68_13260 [Acidobacteriota bacterium]
MRSKTSAIILILAIFALGAITGAVGHYLYLEQTRPEVSPRTSRPAPRDPIDDMAQGLHLDSAQKEKLRAIFAQSRDKYRKLSHEFRPNYESIRSETRQAIREILSEEQKKEFDESIRTEDERHGWRGSRDRKR